MGATYHACIGGTNVRNEMQKLQAEAPHIVVGTPGRVFDMLNRRYLCKYESHCALANKFPVKASYPLRALVYLLSL